MKAPDFDYLRPPTLTAAIALLAEHDGDAMALAGGQSLMAMMNFRVAAPGALIDLADVNELQGITRLGDSLRIGAMTRYVELAHAPEVRADLPLLIVALPHIAHDAIRNRGTIGGSLALADPAAEMPALMLVLDATIEVAGPDGTRLIKADDFFLGIYETALASDELIVAVHIPVARPEQRFAFHELAQRHGDYALAGVAVAQSGAHVRIAFFGVADRAMRLRTLESALSNAPDGAAVQAALPLLDGIEFNGDTKASAATRQRLAGVALTRAFAEMTQ
jgi:carbon-monoxide dehydrogenase medium subunit